MHALSISLLAILSVLAVGNTEAAVVDYGANFTAAGFGSTLCNPNPSIYCSDSPTSDPVSGSFTFSYDSNDVDALGGGTGSGLLASTSSSLQITGVNLTLGSTTYENPSHAYDISEVAINLDFSAGVITQAIIGGLVGGANTDYFGVNDFRLTLTGGGNTFSFFEYTVDTGTFGEGPGWNTASGISSLSAIPIPAAVWLFGSGLLGLVGMARRKKL